MMRTFLTAVLVTAAVAVVIVILFGTTPLSNMFGRVDDAVQAWTTEIRGHRGRLTDIEKKIDGLDDIEARTAEREVGLTATLTKLQATARTERAHEAAASADLSDANRYTRAFGGTVSQKGRTWSIQERAKQLEEEARDRGEGAHILEQGVTEISQAILALREMTQRLALERRRLKSKARVVEAKIETLEAVKDAADLLPGLPGGLAQKLDALSLDVEKRLAYYSEILHGERPPDELTRHIREKLKELPVGEQD